MQNIKTCLACGGTDLFPYLDLGSMPLANSFHDGSKELPVYPLAVQACRTCWHSQLTETVEPHLMFDDYLYVSGTSETLRKYFDNFASWFPSDIRVLDIGSNDGTLLDAFKARNCKTTGVEPCWNLAMSSQKRGHDIWHGYWSKDDVRSSILRVFQFDIITAFNVLAHTPDPLAFLQLAHDSLSPGGSIWVQTSQANMVLDGTFDAIYHEHVSYFTPRSISALAKRAGLSVFAYSEPVIHGGSMLIGLRASSETEDISHKSPLYQEKTYEKFARKVEQTIQTVKSTGFPGPLVGYGAAAKGMTFLNSTGLKPDRIVDDNPLKHGLLTPGGNIPVGPVVDLPRGDGSIVVLAWNFWDEILTRIRTQHGSGHTVVRWFPKFEIVMS